MRDRASFEAALRVTIAELGGLDVLVNNAALTVRRPFFEIEDEEWNEVLAVNLRGVFLGCQLGGAHMREQRRGRIVNLSSLAGQQGSVVNGAHYAASKAGILALTKAVARELAPFGVTVNAVAPAAIEGPLVDALPPDTVTALTAAVPLRRLGRTDEVAGLIAYLASDAAGYVTGSTFDINGGITDAVAVAGPGDGGVAAVARSTAAAAASATWSQNGRPRCARPSGRPRSLATGTTATGTPATECAMAFAHGTYVSTGWSSPGRQPCSGAGPGATGEITTSCLPMNSCMRERNALQRSSTSKYSPAESACCARFSSSHVICGTWRPFAPARSARARAPPSAAIILKNRSSASATAGGATSSTFAPASPRIAAARSTAARVPAVAGQAPSSA